MVKILAIGNSFSDDATFFLHDMAKCGGVDLKVVNLFIGGCVLQLHWENIVNNADDYDRQLNGEQSEKQVSIDEALHEDDWDFITLQQGSRDSGIPETYYPYLKKVSEYVGNQCPNAKQFLHQTWAYEIDSDHSAFPKYNSDQANMFSCIKNCYDTVSEEYGLKIIPSGSIIQALRSTPVFDYKNGGKSLCRDGFHMDYLYGRYATCAAWYEVLLNKNILENSFVPHVKGVETDEKIIGLIKQYVHRIVEEYR